MNEQQDLPIAELKGKALTIEELTIQAEQENISPCLMALGYVIFDVICLGLGALGLRGGVATKTIAEMGELASPVKSNLEADIAILGHEGTSLTQKAGAVFNILSTIYTGGLLGAIFNAFRKSLTWWTATLYAVSGLATIIAALATDGVAFAAAVVIMLVNFGWLLTDASNALKVCGIVKMVEPEAEAETDDSPDQNPLPYLPQLVLVTINGHFVNVTNNGNIAADSWAAFSTNRTEVGPWEKFTFEIIDEDAHTFALKTVNGNYVTAIEGGGEAGVSTHTWPITTNSKAITRTETLIVCQQEDGTYALMTSGGFYLTANNGGGQYFAGDPMRTNNTTIGPLETFSFQTIQNDGLTYQQVQQGTLNV